MFGCKAEREEPLLARILPFIQDRPLITTQRAVVQFEHLLTTYHGPTESERWKELLPKLSVFPTVSHDPSEALTRTQGN